MSVIDEMRGEFLAEAEELIDEIHTDLQSLEGNGEDGQDDLIRRVMRKAHSLKGSSGMFGFNGLSDVSHSLENVLEEISAGRMGDWEGAIAATLDQVEVMRMLLSEAVSESEPETPSSSDRPGPAKIDEETEEDHPSELHENDPHATDVNRFLRIDLGQLDRAMNLVGDLSLGLALLRRAPSVERVGRVGRSAYERRDGAARLMERRLDELRECLLGMRMVPLGRVFNRLRPAIRSVTRMTGKEANLDIHGSDTRLDKIMAEKLADPLIHLIRNAIDHGIETPEERRAQGKPEEGQVSLSARRAGSEVIIEVSDDGQGIHAGHVREKACAQGILSPGGAYSERQILDCLFVPGFSTAEQVDSVSGRGVGMDVVRTNVARLSGRVGIRTEEGKGTTVSIRVPPTLSTIDGLLVGAVGEAYVVPFHSVVEVFRIDATVRQAVAEEATLPYQDTRIPGIILSAVLGHDSEGRDGEFAVVVRAEAGTVAMVVDSLGERRELLIKPLGPKLGALEGFSGVTELADGRVAMVLDVSSVLKGVIGFDEPGK